jgi:hypothetical protein
MAGVFHAGSLRQIYAGKRRDVTAYGVSTLKWNPDADHVVNC